MPRPEINISHNSATCDAPNCLKYLPGEENSVPTPLKDGDHALIVGNERGFKLYHHTNERYVHEEPSAKATWVIVRLNQEAE